jgi:hypothetical protein
MRPFMPRGRHAGGLAAGVETAEGDHPPAQSRTCSGWKAGTRLRSLAAARPARMRSDGLKDPAGLRGEKEEAGFKSREKPPWPSDQLALEDEFALDGALSEARSKADMTQEQIAEAPARLATELASRKRPKRGYPKNVFLLLT